jgi:hypothetical protein
MIGFIITSATNSLVITLNYKAIAFLHTLQSLHTNLLCANLYSTNLQNSPTAPSCTALIPIGFLTANRLLISLYYSTHNIFKSQADFFFNYELPQLSLTADCYRKLQLASCYAGNLAIIPWPGTHSRKQGLYCCVTRACVV